MKVLNEKTPIIYVYTPYKYGSTLPEKFWSNIIEMRGAYPHRTIYFVTNAKGLTSTQNLLLEEKCNTGGIEYIDITQSKFKFNNFLVKDGITLEDYFNQMYHEDAVRLRERDGNIRIDIEIDLLKVLALTEAKDIDKSNGLILIDFDITSRDFPSHFSIPTGLILGTKYARDDLIAISDRKHSILKNISNKLMQSIQRGDYEESIGTKCIMCASINEAIVQFEQETSAEELWKLADKDGEIHFSIRGNNQSTRNDTVWFTNEQRHLYKNDEIIDIHYHLKHDTIIIDSLGNIHEILDAPTLL